MSKQAEANERKQAQAHTFDAALAEAKEYAMHYNCRAYVLRSKGNYYVHTELSALCSPRLIVAKALANGTTIVTSKQEQARTN